MTEWDCCASAGGEFKEVELDAVITDVVMGNVTKNQFDWGESEAKVTIKIFHNQDVVALMEAFANDGNAGYYYSVASLIVKEIGKEKQRCDVVEC